MSQATSSHIIKTIKVAVAEYYQIPPMLLYGRRRDDFIAWPRQIAMALCRENGGWISFKELGRAFNRHHACILHSIKAVKERTQCFPRLAADVDKLREIVKARLGQEEKVA